MERIIERLPSPGGVALWLYGLAFVVLPAMLAYEGFAYIIGIVVFAVGVHPYIDSIVAGTTLRFAISWRGKRRIWSRHVAVPNERLVVKSISIGLILLSFLVVPVLVFVIQKQGQMFYTQVGEQLPAILGALDAVLEYAHQQVPGLIPDIEVRKGDGWEGLSGTLGQVAGDAIKDIKAMLQSIFGNLLGVLGGLLGDWVKLVIAAIIVGTILNGWDKEVKMHRAIITGGIKDEQLRANVLRFGELYQTGVSLFMIGYLEVAVTITVLYGVAMLVLPLGLSIGAILFMSVILGFVTAIPKIGGLLSMALALLLMVTNIAPGLGWFGWTVFSFGTAIDVLVRTGLLMAVAKLYGVLEAYNYTPEIIGERLGMTKMQIIATIIIWALGAGFFGMIWGILISLAFQAALRLSYETAEAEAAVGGAVGSEVEAAE